MSESSLLIPFLVDVSIQVIFYIYSALRQSEVFYDISASLTYIICILFSLFFQRPASTISSYNPRQILAAILVMVWAARLGTFLFIRVLRTPDKRFDDLKTNFVKFSIPWFLQIMWIFITALPAFIIILNSPSSQPPFGSGDAAAIADWVGLAIWIFGFAVEVTADTQKQIFKNKYPSKFIRTGIWKYSRYANYNGEITLWFGFFVMCARGLVEAWQWVCVISPVFVACLILLLSGVPLLEKSSDKRYGKDPGE
jgi:steroid 5-alpha reductase family enzyme